MKSSKNKNSKLDDFINNPNKSLWDLAIPMMFGMMVQTIYSLVDMIFVGMVGSNSLTALAFNLPILFFGMGLVFGLGSGSGFFLAIVGLAAIREKIRYSNVPGPIRGLGITFIITGLMGLGFMCFMGIKI